MKIIINLPEELKNAKLTVSKDIPIHVNSDIEKIGIADVNIENMTAELNIKEEFSKEILNKIGGGGIIERNSNIIFDFNQTNNFLENTNMQEDPDCL